MEIEHLISSVLYDRPMVVFVVSGLISASVLGIVYTTTRSKYYLTVLVQQSHSTIFLINLVKVAARHLDAKNTTDTIATRHSQPWTMARARQTPSP